MGSNLGVSINVSDLLCSGQQLVLCMLTAHVAGGNSTVGLACLPPEAAEGVEGVVHDCPHVAAAAAVPAGWPACMCVV
jgi:hypothetical protein